jgi:hypothetical protein
MKIPIWMVLGFNLLEAGDQPRTETSVRLVLPADATPVVKNLCTLLTRQIQQRCDAKVETSGEAKLMVEMAMEQSSPATAAPRFRPEGSVPLRPEASNPRDQIL